MNRRRRTYSIHPVSGFTLVEMLAAMVILATIGTLASRCIVTALDGYMRGNTQAQLHSELTIAMERIERELRHIPLKQNYGSVAPNITSLSASSLVWGGNSALSLSNGQLRLTDAGAGPAMLLHDVASFSVRAFDQSNAALAATLSGAACDPIRRIEISITLERSGVSESLRTRVFLRNTSGGA